MTLDQLQRIYFKYQWANGTAIYAARYGTAAERAAAEKAALDAYETYLRARVEYEREKGAAAA